MGIPAVTGLVIIGFTQPLDRLNFIMGIPLPVRRCLFSNPHYKIKTVWWLCKAYNDYTNKTVCS